MLKKFFSFLLMILIMTTMSMVAVNAESTSKIYFEVPEDWENYSRVFCHIWEYGGKHLADWQSKKQRCTQVEGNLYEYDTFVVGGLEKGKIYGVIFSVDIGLQTYDMLMSAECLGSTVYCKDEYYYSPQDTEKYVLPAYWKNIDAENYGPVKFISGTGDIQGTCFAPGRSGKVLLTEFIDLWLDRACVIKNESADEIITRLGTELGLNEMEISQAVYNAQTPVAWDYPDDFVPETEEEIPTDIIVDNTTSVLDEIPSEPIVADTTATFPQYGEDGAFTYYVNLKTPEKLEDVQATISYNSNVLEFVSFEIPNLINAVVNPDIPGYIYFNALDIKTGMDFTEDKLLIKVEFKVIGSDEADINISFVEMNAYYSEKYFYFGEQLNPDVIVTERVSSSIFTTNPTEDYTSVTDNSNIPADIVETGNNYSLMFAFPVLFSLFIVIVFIKKKTI